MKTLIVGNGEVGSALAEVLRPFYDLTMRDVDDVRCDPDVMHICFPYTEEFVHHVNVYRMKYQPELTIIHSTVPVGTSRRCDAVHSPIRGNHPFLAEGIRKFVKFVGGTSPAVDRAAEYFRRASLKVYLCRTSEATELAKIADTTFYAVCIEYVKEVDRICNRLQVPFAEAFTLWQQSYNEGWSQLGFPEYQRPVLVPIQGAQGGHCTLPNLQFLPNSQFAKLIAYLNSPEVSDG